MGHPKAAAVAINEAWEPHPILNIPTKEEFKAMDPKMRIPFFKKRRELIKLEKEEPYEYGFELESWKRADEVMASEGLSEMLLMGGNRCISGTSKIYDPLKKTFTPVSEIKGTHFVRAWDGTKLVDSQADEPFIKGSEMMYRVELSNGEHVEVTQSHRILTKEGYQKLSSLSVGSQLHSPLQKGENHLHTQLSCVQTGWNRVVNSLGDCLNGFRSYGERPHLSSGTDQELSPSRDDALKHTHYHTQQGGEADVSCNTHPSSSILSPMYDLYHALCRFGKREIEQSRCGQLLSFEGLPAQTSLLSSGRDHQTRYHGQASLSYSCSSSSAESRCRSLTFLKGKIKSSLRSYIQRSRCGGLLSRFFYSYTQNITITQIYATKKESVWDFNVPVHHNYEMGGVIHHNSSKSEYCAKRCVEALCHNPNTTLWAFSMNHDNSVQMQQRYIYKYLPDQYKKVGKGKIAYVKFNMKNGFTDNRFILPNGSEMVFRNYSQELRTIEGGETGSKFWDPFHPRVPESKRDRIANIGVWADELIPLDFVETLRYRLLDRSATMMISFTAVDGYSPTVKEYLVGAKTLVTAKAPLLGPTATVPLIQQCKRKSAKIVYFHTSENPYAGYTQMKQTLDGAPEDEILCRAYGVPTKPVKSKFPKFRDTVNVLPLSDIPFLIPHPEHEDRYLVDPDQEVTIYHGTDPAGSKPWFMLWAGVTPIGTYFFHEYPDISYGKWADVTKGKRGVYGEACRPNGYGIEDYVDLIKDIELQYGIDEVFERIIDPRFGVAKRSNATAATSIVDDLQDAGMEMIPAQLKTIDDGIQDVNDMLAYDDQKPIDSMNHPKLYIADTCENLIYSMQEYTGEFGKDEVTKDPIDTMRYIVGENACFIDQEEYQDDDIKRY